MSGQAPGILFSTGALYVYPLRRAFEVARAAGCDGVELVVRSEVVRRGPQAVLRIAEESGMPIRAIHPPLFGFWGWRRSLNPVPRLVDLALAMRIPTIVVHPPHVETPDDERQREFVEAAKAARIRLQGTGTELTLENPGIFKPSNLRFIYWHMPALCRLTGDLGLRVTLDTTHAGSSPYALPDTYRMASDRLAHVHLSDYRCPPRLLDQPVLATYFKHHQLPGSGTLPLAEFLGGLTRDGFGGNITLELSPVLLRIWDLRQTVKVLREAVGWTREMLRQRPGAA